MRTLIFSLALFLISFPNISSAKSDNFKPDTAWVPSGPIEFVIMAGKGGGADKAARLIKGIIERNKFSPVPIQVVNISGNSGGDALTHLKRKAGNNHTLLFTLNSFFTTPLSQTSLGVDIREFAPIARLAQDTFCLWVHSDRKDINTFSDFVKAVKAEGSNWVMAGTGKLSEDNLLTDFLNIQFKLKMTYRPFKGGGAVAKQLVEKKVHSTVNNPAEQQRHYKKGLTKPLAVFTRQRLPQYPDVPTIGEEGLDFEYFMQRTIAGPPGMSKEAQAFYTYMFKRAFDTPAWQAYRTENSLTGDFIGGEELMAYWIREVKLHQYILLMIDRIK